jgi:hypothetical protein
VSLASGGGMKSLHLAFLLISVLLLGPVHADSGADLRAALVLVELGVDSFRSVPFHTPDPRVAFAYKSEELIAIDRQLLRLTNEGQLPELAQRSILHSSTVMASITTSVPNGEISPDQVVEWQTKQLNALKNLRGQLRAIAGVDKK